MNNTVLIIIFVVVILMLAIFLPALLVRRAMVVVIKIFRANNAVTETNAKVQGDLGLNPKNLLDRFFTLRDYKPQALELLIEARIVQVTNEGKLYLSEQKLTSSNLI